MFVPEHSIEMSKAKTKLMEELQEEMNYLRAEAESAKAHLQEATTKFAAEKEALVKHSESVDGETQQEMETLRQEIADSQAKVEKVQQERQETLQEMEKIRQEKEEIEKQKSELEERATKAEEMKEEVEQRDKMIEGLKNESEACSQMLSVLNDQLQEKDNSIMEITSNSKLELESLRDMYNHSVAAKNKLSKTQNKKKLRLKNLKQS